MFGAVGRRVQESQRSKRAQAIPFTSETTAPLPGQPIKRQWEFICSNSKAIKLECSRRAGKTAGIVQRVCKQSWENAGRRTLYIHHTLGNAKRQFFDPPGAESVNGVLGTLDRHGIVYTPNNTEVFVELENGSFIQAVGCDNMAQVRKKLGFFWDEIIIDECQEFADELLRFLVETVLSPTLIDTHGSLIFSGTPPKVLAGFWWEVINNPVYELFAWTMLDNPLISREAIVDEMAKAGHTIDFDNPENNHPIVQREIFGRNVVDTTAMLYEYVGGRNDWPAEGVPLIEPMDAWRFAMGIDIGGVNAGNDSDGIVVWGWRVDDAAHTIWERESYRWGEDTKDRLDIEEFCDAVLGVYRRWRPMMAMCADTGGAGAVKAIAWLSKRMNGLVFTPKPTSVELSQRAFNDDLRSGRMKINPHGALAKALKTARKDAHEPDVAAAGRYGHHGAYHFLAKAPPAALTMREQRFRHLEHMQRIRNDPYSPYRRAS